jgi:Acetyltransferase (GNAT) family
LKLRELKVIEHETSARLDKPLSTQELDSLLTDVVQLPHTFGGMTEDHCLVLFRHEHTADIHTCIVTEREDQKAPVGYIRVRLTGERWQVDEVWLKPELRGKGIITNLYRCLTAAGYPLQSGHALTSAAEKVWLALGRAGVAKVLDSETGRIESFSNKPVGDGDIVAGISPRFYWITEGQMLLTTAHRGGLELLQAGRDAWLSGESKVKPGLAGMCSIIIEGEV